MYNPNPDYWISTKVWDAWNAQLTWNTETLRHLMLELGYEINVFSSHSDKNKFPRNQNINIIDQFHNVFSPSG